MVPQLVISTTILLIGLHKDRVIAPRFYDLMMAMHAVQAIIMMTYSVGLHIGAIRSMMSQSVQ